MLGIFCGANIMNYDIQEFGAMKGFVRWRHRIDDVRIYYNIVTRNASSWP